MRAISGPVAGGEHVEHEVGDAVLERKLVPDVARDGGEALDPAQRGLGGVERDPLVQGHGREVVRGAGADLDRQPGGLRQRLGDRREVAGAEERLARRDHRGRVPVAARPRGGSSDT